MSNNNSPDDLLALAELVREYQQADAFHERQGYDDCECNHHLKSQHCQDVSSARNALLCFDLDRALAAAQKTIQLTETLTKTELLILYKWLERQSLPYDDYDLHKVVEKIRILTGEKE